MSKYVSFTIPQQAQYIDNSIIVTAIHPSTDEPPLHPHSFKTTLALVPPAPPLLPDPLAMAATPPIQIPRPRHPHT